MISATRMLCQKYTDLTDAEISYLESYGALLPALANAEQADVFIDCRTVSGRSAIVVCEAKPQTVPSNYRSSILGMLIHWRDEPAVDRSFRLAVAASGVRAVSMPEDRRIVQSVEPLFYEGRLIGVLIYERPALAAEEPPPAGEREAEQARYLDLVEQARTLGAQPDCGLLVLDEVCAAVNTGLLPLEEVISCLDRAAGEVVLTGRDPDPALVGRADYITEMGKLRHPFDLGTAARPGVEY